MWHALNLQHNLWQISRPLWPLSTQMALSMRAGTLLHRGAQLRCQLIAIFLHKVQSTSHSSMSGLYYCPRQRSYPQFGKTAWREAAHHNCKSCIWKRGTHHSTRCLPLRTHSAFTSDVFANYITSSRHVLVTCILLGLGLVPWPPHLHRFSCLQTYCNEQTSIQKWEIQAGCGERVSSTPSW